MQSENLDIDIIDFLDLLNETLGSTFVERWRYKYSEKFIKHFQLKLLSALNKQKPIKIEMLYNYLTKKCKYSDEQVLNFFQTIEIEIYSPFIYGRLKKR
tara:strand:- start:57 stop:353 length:297 start_codon:yes stop_codon:yes gene_type:complete